jgi:hypothetical protein
MDTCHRCGAHGYAAREAEFQAEYAKPNHQEDDSLRRSAYLVGGTVYTVLSVTAAAAALVGTQLINGFVLSRQPADNMFGQTPSYQYHEHSGPAASKTINDQCHEKYGPKGNRWSTDYIPGNPDAKCAAKFLPFKVPATVILGASSLFFAAKAASCFNAAYPS